MLDISASAHLSCNEVYAFACSRPRTTPRAYDVIDALGKNGDDGWVITIVLRMPEYNSPQFPSRRGDSDVKRQISRCSD